MLVRQAEKDYEKRIRSLVRFGDVFSQSNYRPRCQGHERLASCTTRQHSLVHELFWPIAQVFPDGFPDVCFMCLLTCLKFDVTPEVLRSVPNVVSDTLPIGRLCGVG